MRGGAESGGTVIVLARRVGNPRGEVSAHYATFGGSAVAGVDYMAGAGTLRWADLDTEDKAISIAIVDDLAIEGDETFAMALSDPEGAEVEGIPATVVIEDDDRVGDTLAATSSGRLISFDRASPAVLRHAAIPSGLVSGEAIVGMDFRPRDRKLYAITTRAQVYTVDLASGALALVSALTADPGDASEPFSALSGATFGVDFNPVVDRLRVVSDTGQNLRINVETGRTFSDATIRGAAIGLAAAGYENNVAEACRTRLYAIDPVTDRLVIQDPPNEGVTTAIGPGLGVDASAALLDLVTGPTGATAAFAILTVGGTSGLYAIDLAAGTARSAGALALGAGETLRGLALQLPASSDAIAQAPGELVGVTDAHRVITFNRAAPAKICTTSAIGGLAPQDEIVGIDVRPSTGVLYALVNRAGRGMLYALDPVTGVASSPVALTQPLVGTAFGMDFNPTGSVALRIVSNAGQNLRVTDVTTGATAADGGLNGPSAGASGAAYTNSVQGAGTTTLYTIDAAADRLRIQSPPNVGTQIDVGALGVDIAMVSGFEIDGRDNAAFVALELAGGAATTFHTIDLASGAVSASLGVLGEGERLRGLTRPAPTTTVFGLLESNLLVTISLANPSTPTPVGAVTGLATGETLLGIDFRPSTGVLHGLGSLGSVYAIDPATAAATRVSTLTADPTDATSSFAGLSGTDFGVDFNPTGPVALRVTSDAEQNLRIPNVLTGATFTDLDVNTLPRGYKLGGAAYANNVPGATTTTLYAIDTAAGKLVAIVPPNAGAIREIGPVRSDLLVGSIGFDIVAENTALAAVDGPASLVSIDLATGSVSLVGAIQPTNTNGLPFAAPVGLAAPPSATPPAGDSTVYAVDAGHQLVQFPRNRPGQAVRIGILGTVSPDESVVGIDFRPSTGELWMLTRDLANAGRLYTVDSLAVGQGIVATKLRATLAAYPADATSPYTALDGGALGMDFNPTGPVALRIVSAAGQNLRVVDPMTGKTFTDAAINTPPPDATAAAYSNSFPGASTTTLFVIDVGSGQLMIQSLPNNGVLTPVGALSTSLSFAGRSAFDIAGGANGLALAALQRSGAAETFSRLYRVDLTTGAATEIGTGVGTGPALRGIAIRIR